MVENLVEKAEYLEGYSTTKALAKDLCWAMALAPSCSNVRAHEIEGYGWVVDCDCTDRKNARTQLHSILKKRYFNVNWV